MVLSLSICCARLGALQLGGASGWKSMANALCNLGLGLGLSNFLVLLLPVTVIHFSFISLSSSVPVQHRLSPDSLPLLAYPPNSAENLWCGLNATLSLSQIDLKQ